LESGDIIIDPFDERNLGTNSYDFRLGEYFWREVRYAPHGMPFYNPYDEANIRAHWYEQKALSYRDFMKLNLPVWSIDRHRHKGVSDDDKVFLIEPGETLLCHTEEFIGGSTNALTTMMKGRSSTARNRIKICSDAGLGDIGYCNRWTMEVTNFGEAPTLLVAGRRIGQMLFFETEPLEEGDGAYVSLGKYQKHRDLEELKKNWSPESMLPRQWEDWEIQGVGTVPTGE
jgi:dCTP deaminase